MSFGFSPSDIAALISLTSKAYHGWKQAPDDYADIVHTLRSFRLILDRLKSHFRPATDTSASSEPVADEWLARQAAARTDLRRVLKGSETAVRELDRLAKQFKGLSSSHLKRLRLGWANIDGPLSRLARHMGALNTVLQTVELDSIDRLRATVRDKLEALPVNVSSAVTVALGRIIDTRLTDSDSARDSVLTSHSDDDKLAWRELRRELRDLGIGDSMVRKHKVKLKAFVESIVTDIDISADAGAADGENPSILVEHDDSKIAQVDSSMHAHTRQSTLDANDTTFETDREENESADLPDCMPAEGESSGPVLEEAVRPVCQHSSLQSCESCAHPEESELTAERHSRAQLPEERLSEASSESFSAAEEKRNTVDDLEKRQIEGASGTRGIQHRNEQKSPKSQSRKRPKPLKSRDNNKSSSDRSGQAAFPDETGLISPGLVDEDCVCDLFDLPRLTTETRSASSQVDGLAGRLIEYRPLNVKQDGRLTVKLYLPPGWHVEDSESKTIQFRDRFAGARARSRFPLPPIWTESPQGVDQSAHDSDRQTAATVETARKSCGITALAYCSSHNNVVGFNSRDGEALCDAKICEETFCGYTSIPWNSTREHCNPDFLSDLRLWAARPAPSEEDIVLSNRIVSSRLEDTISRLLPVDLCDILRGKKFVGLPHASWDKKTQSLVLANKLLCVPITPCTKSDDKIKHHAIAWVNGTWRDVHLTVEEVPHPLFIREDDDLRYTRCPQAGGLCEIPFFDVDEDHTVRLKSFNPADRFSPSPSKYTKRYPGLGLPTSKDASVRGDLIVEFEPDVDAWFRHCGNA